jgi:hypothetical protein
MTEPRNTGGTLVRRKMSYETHYTQIPNAYLRDKRTGFKAKGILAHLLSHADGYEVSLTSLADVSDRDGVAAVRAGVEELEAAGYLVRESRRGRGAPGTYGTRWILTEPSIPLFEAERSGGNRMNTGRPSFDNRMDSSCENRTHKEHHLRTSIPGTRDTPSTPAHEKIGCRHGRHTYEPGSRYCLHCAEPRPEAE